MSDKVGAFNACKYCGTRFKRKTIWHEYCNDKCRMDDFYIKRGEEAKARKKK